MVPVATIRILIQQYRPEKMITEHSITSLFNIYSKAHIPLKNGFALGA